MANIIFAEQENAHLHPPSLKLRQRLYSAPEKHLKSPMPGKSINTPLPSGRKAFGRVNKKVSISAVNAHEKRLLKPQETNIKSPSQTKVEEYPEIEKFIPYDPLESRPLRFSSNGSSSLMCLFIHTHIQLSGIKFERCSIPEDLVPLSGLALPGLARFSPPLCEDDLEKLDPLPNMSPMKMPRHSDYCLELDLFLQTLDELTVELPPESVNEY